jgi:glycosyltransferase involved in cell wall biosynthesis
MTSHAAMVDPAVANGRPRLLVAGVPPVGRAGNAVSTEVLLAALEPIADVTLLSHRASPLPTWTMDHPTHHVRLGSQPLSVHGEAFVSGFVHRARLRAWTGAWVVNSRYASALYTAGIPYVIWEATTIRDELEAIPFAAIRRSGRGTGFGRALHYSMLPLGSRLEARIYRQATMVMAMSEYTRRRIIEQHGLEPDRIGVLTHPPAPEFSRLLRNRVQRAPRDDASDLRLLFVGRADDPRKNFPLLLNALRHLIAGGMAVTLSVLGPHNPRWRSSLDMQGLGDRVAFSGSVSSEALADAYLSHDLLVLPSVQEGFGIVVAEALAAGLPVVSTRSGGPEQIIRDSGAGVLVEHESSALARGIIEMSPVETRRGMARRALAYSAEALSFDRFASQVAQVTTALLDRHDATDGVRALKAPRR